MNVWSLDSVKGPYEQPSQGVDKINSSITDLLIKPSNVGHRRTAA